MTIAVGDRFPAVTVDTVDGSMDLAAKWSQGPLVIAFHRIWCPFCQQAATQLSAALPQLKQFGADAVIVYREDTSKVAEVCTERHTTPTCASDPAQTLEKAVELQRFRLLKYAAFGPGKLIRAMRDRSKVRGVKPDTLQGRGTFVVNPHGRVVYAHLATNAATDPKSDDPDTTHARQAIKGAWGAVPNLGLVMAQSLPLTLAALAFDAALEKGSVHGGLGEQLAIAVSHENRCAYCLAAHSAAARHYGVSAEDIAQARTGDASDPKTAAALTFSQELVAKRGLVSADGLDTLRSAGWAEGEITELVGHAISTTLSNYLHHLSGVPIDYPEVPFAN